MPLEDTIQRTNGRKDDEQQIKVISTNNTAVTLKFVNNAFRKHVMIKSQKTANPTSGESKADNIRLNATPEPEVRITERQQRRIPSLTPAFQI